MLPDERSVQMECLFYLFLSSMQAVGGCEQGWSNVAGRMYRVYVGRRSLEGQSGGEGRQGLEGGKGTVWVGERSVAVYRKLRSVLFLCLCWEKESSWRA